MKRVFTLLLAAAMAFALCACGGGDTTIRDDEEDTAKKDPVAAQYLQELAVKLACPLYTSPSPRDRTRLRMPSSA